MDRCPNCGNKLSEIDVLCPKCGTVVEVIKTGNNMPSPMETAAESSVKKPAAAQKKDIPKYFNVYYEDLPGEGDEDEVKDEPEAVSEVPEEAEPPVNSSAYQQPEPPVSFNAYRQPESPVSASAYRQPESFRPIIEESYSEGDRYRNREFNDTAAAKKSEEDENDFSSRYLENLKNLHLPEIEDISNFDPEEYMREYKYKKILGEQAALGGASDAAKKQWLEIEETENNLESELAKVREDVQRQAEQPEVPQRRYRGPQDSRTERKRDTEKRRDFADSVPVYTERNQSNTEKTQDFTERNQSYTERNQVYPERSQEFTEEGSQMPAENKKARMPKAVGMVLFWIIISVAIFFGSLYLHNSIRYSHQSYDKFFFSITNGQVNLHPEIPK